MRRIFKIRCSSVALLLLPEYFRTKTFFSLISGFNIDSFVRSRETRGSRKRLIKRKCLPIVKTKRVKYYGRDQEPKMVHTGSLSIPS